MNLPDFLAETAEGEIRLTGHRIGLFHLIRRYNDGYSPEMLVCQYPTLSLAVVHKVIAYYLENRAAVDRYVAACAAELARQQEANPQRLDISALRARLELSQQSGKP
jgi:uncharacterized protein (DUF433 family)